MLACPGGQMRALPGTSPDLSNTLQCSWYTLCKRTPPSLGSLLRCSLPEHPSPPARLRGSAPCYSPPDRSPLCASPPPLPHGPGFLLCHSPCSGLSRFTFVANVSVFWAPYYIPKERRGFLGPLRLPTGCSRALCTRRTLTTRSSNRRRYPFTAHGRAERVPEL